MLQLVTKAYIEAYVEADNKDENLEEKLERELPEPSELFSESFLEDIRRFLIHNNWENDVLCAIMEKKNVINELAYALHNDDLFADFFETRLRQLVLELAV